MIGPHARACDSALARPGWWGSRDTNNVSWLGGSLVSQHNAQHGCDTAPSAQRHGKRGAATCTVPRATRREARARVVIQFLYRDRGARHSSATQRASAHMCPTTRLGSANIRQGRGPRHGPTNARTRRPKCSVRAAWAQWACRLGLGCVPGAPNPVLTQCTVLSHCS